MKTRTPRAIALCILTLAAAAFGSIASAAAADTIRYGIDDEQNINRLPQVIAQREGFFAREGVEVQIVPLAVSFRAPPGANPITMREAMAKGDIDMARQQFPLLINDVMGGPQSRGGLGGEPQPAVFRGRSRRDHIICGSQGQGARNHQSARRDHGMDAKVTGAAWAHRRRRHAQDIAGSRERLACLKSADCAAASLAQPAVLDAIEAGAHTLGLTNEIGPPLYQFDIVDPARAPSHRDAIIKYIRATWAAVRFITDPKNRDEVVKATMAYMKEPENRSREMLNPIWDPKNRVLPEPGVVDMDSVRTAIGLLGEYGVLRQPLPAPDRFIDTAYAEAASR
jgi:ABC-type nitrate/sulfonate/bicarbonate transport system substrate-binding protein